MSDQAREQLESDGRTRELLEALKSPSLWPDDSTEVELIETHISWVFLTRSFAFKLKKPVTFDFLDFSTLSARKAACEDEVRLNRRLAPDVYLGVAAITREPDGKLHLAGKGNIVDYLVQMRRLSKADRLDLRMEKQDLQSEDLQPLIKKLTKFYQQAEPLNLPPEDYLQVMESHVRDNMQVLLQNEIESGLTRRVCQHQLQLLKLQPELLRERVTSGHVIEGHGDLRPEHIYLTETPVIVDCIEFNADFRQLDIADELCFLAMECDAMQQGIWGEQVLHRCLENLNDHPARLLLAFYKSYRATVRAKVSALRAAQQEGKAQQQAVQTTVNDLRLGEAYLAEFNQPTLFVASGLMGAGKSTLASALAEALGMEHLQTDKIREELFGTEDAEDAFGAGKYSAEQRQQVYETLFNQAEEKLSAGLSVIIDGSFSQRALRTRTIALAKQTKAKHVLIWCECPVEVAEERIARRRAEGKDASQARPELLTQQLAAAELPEADEHAIVIQTTQPQEELLPEVFQQLGSIQARSASE